VGIPTTDEMTKNALCQEKSNFRDLVTVDDFGLEKSKLIFRISLVAGRASN